VTIGDFCHVLYDHFDYEHVFESFAYVDHFNDVHMLVLFLYDLATGHLELVI
jgi:hypothetical protein